MTKYPEVDPRLRDFRNVAYLVWRHLGFEPTPIQYEIADYIQSDGQRLFISGYRGVGKSLLCSAFVLHQLLLDPTHNVVVVSASKARADLFSGFCMQLMREMEVFQHLYPRDDQRNAKIAFDVAPAPAAHQPSVYSCGATGQLTGMRASILVADDVESLNNSMTVLMRERLLHRIGEFEALMRPGGRQIILGTPQSHESIYNQLPEKGFRTRYWPARYPSQSDIVHYAGCLAPSIADALEEDPELEGKPTDPGRFSDLDLAERQASYGRQQFALQYQLNTSLSDADRWPLKLTDLVVHDLDDELLPERVIWAADPDLAIKDLPCIGYTGDRYYRPFKIQGDHLEPAKTILALDPAGRGKDETAYSVVSELNGQLFLRECKGLKGGYDEATLKRIARAAKKWKVNELIIESNFGDGAVTELLRPILNEVYPCALTETRSSSQKELRIIDQTLEPIMSSHRLVVDRKVLEDDYRSVQNSDRGERSVQYSLAYQISRITRSKGSLSQDDRLDSLALACAHFVEMLAKDAQVQIQKRKQELAEAAIERFLDEADGVSRTRRNNWLSTSSLGRQTDTRSRVR